VVFNWIGWLETRPRAVTKQRFNWSTETIYTVFDANKTADHTWFRSSEVARTVTGWELN
jgi:hypothetical protein